jgi:hypothetical protein
MERLIQIPTLTNYYFDTKTYEVYSFKASEPHKMTKTLAPNGYLYICFYLGNKVQKSLPLHQIVWLTFNGSYDKFDTDGTRMCLNHINENKLDNRFENLELISFKKNIQYNRYGKNYVPKYSRKKVA